MRQGCIRFISLLLFVITSVAWAASPESLFCSEKDENLIDSIAKRYFEEHSSFTSQDITTSSYFCFDGYSSARIKLNPPSTIQAIVYLQKIKHKWHVILLGSAFNPRSLQQIPPELRAATGQIDVTV